MGIRALAASATLAASGHYPRFTNDDAKFLQMTSQVLSTNFATLNTAKFRPARTQHALTTDDSAIKGWYVDANSDAPFSPCFGWIQRMFRHSLYPGGPEHMVVEVEWLNMLPPNASGLPTGLRVHDRDDDDPGHLASYF